MHYRSLLSADRLRHGLALVAAVVAVPALAACGAASGSGSGASGGSSSESADSRLANAGASVQKAMTQYLAGCRGATRPRRRWSASRAPTVPSAARCTAMPTSWPSGGGFSAPAPELSTARNAAQLLANSLEILGDAQPTQANYDQVLNTFNVNNAISSLQEAVAKVQSARS